MKKSLAVGMTFLFLGTCITPSVAIDNEKKSSIPISSSKILYVGGTGEGNYLKIQDAIDDASDGDTVFVYDDSSPYYESLRIEKRINLIGEDRNTTIINGGYEDTIIIFEDVNNVLIYGFTITGRIIDWGTSAGILIQGDNNCIQGNKIIFNHNGILIDDYSDNNIITNNIIVHNNVRGIYDHWGGSENTITWNVIGGNGRDGLHYEKGRGIYKVRDGGIYHHNDFDLNWGYNALTQASDWGTWDDGSEGNFWDDWESNPGYPDVYIIKGNIEDQIDYHPSTSRYINYTLVNIERVTYEENPGESIEFDSDVNRPSSAVSWLWDFGDGNTSDKKNPTYSFSESGIYDIIVRVTDDKGQSDIDKGIAYIGFPPDAPIIEGPTKCRLFSMPTYSFVANDSDSDYINYYIINWGDGPDQYYEGPYPTGEKLTVKHYWEFEGNTTISVKAIDETLRESEWAYLDVQIPRPRTSLFLWFHWLLECFPVLERLLNLLR